MRVSWCHHERLDFDRYRTSVSPSHDAADLRAAETKTNRKSQAFSAQRRSTAQHRDPEVSADPGWYRVCCRAGCRAKYPLTLVVVISFDAGTHERSLARQLDQGRMCLQSESIALSHRPSRSIQPVSSSLAVLVSCKARVRCPLPCARSLFSKHAFQ